MRSIQEDAWRVCVCGGESLQFSFVSSFIGRATKIIRPDDLFFGHFLIHICCNMTKNHKRDVFPKKLQ